MLPFEERLIARLLADETVTGIAGTDINWVARPDTGNLPALTLTVASDPLNYNHDGRDGWQEVRVQVDARSTSYLEAKQLSRAALEALEPPLTIEGAIEFADGMRVSGSDMARETFAGGTEVFRVRQDIMIPYLPSTVPTPLPPEPPPEPLAVSDFQNGVYTIGGEAVAITDMWEQNLANAEFDPSHVVAGQGLHREGVWSGPAATAALLAALGDGNVFANGLTAVFDVVFSEVTDYFDCFLVDLNVDVFTRFWSVNTWQNDLQLAIGGGANVSAFPVAVGYHRLAVTLGPDGLGLSVDGSETVVLAPALPVIEGTADSLVVSVRDGTYIQKVTFYTRQPL